jgi:glucose/arabinose dehydrogenase
MKKAILIALLCIHLKAFAQSTLMIGTTELQVDTVITGLDIPWEIIYGPDNHIWTTERKGIVSRINPTTGTKTVVLNLLANVEQQSESGMLGLILHPNFPITPEVFLTYTYNASGIKERIVKYTYNGSMLINEQVLIDNIPGNSTHIGCRFLMLPDTTLLATTGDAQNLSLPQDLNSLAGKVLRMNLDGSIPANNPIPGSYVYAWGFRNSQGLAFGPNGNIYTSEHGASSDDEFQILEPNRNYGWPNVEGFCDEPSEATFCTANNVKEPLLVWTPTIAPSDIVYYENPSFPEFHQKMLMTVLKDKKLIAMEMNTAGTVVLNQDHHLTNLFGRLRDICVGPDKEIYLATNGASWANTSPNTHNIIVLKTLNSLNNNNHQLENEIKVFPNPLTNTLNVMVPLDMLGGTIAMYDITGSIVLKAPIHASSNAISTEHFLNGCYILVLTDVNGNRINKKIIK